MINIDTNIIVRVFLADDKEQYEEAKKILNQNNKFYISSYVLLEFVWVLKSKKYTRQEIHSFLSEIIEVNNLVIGQKDLIVKSLDRYKKGDADFSDYMIYEDGFINEAKILKTFDKKLLKELG